MKYLFLKYNLKLEKLIGPASVIDISEHVEHNADYGISSGFAVHHILNSAGKYILENVANLDKLPPNGATIIIAPIKIEGDPGGQARIWAILP